MVYGLSIEVRIFGTGGRVSARSKEEEEEEE